MGMNARQEFTDARGLAVTTENAAAAAHLDCAIRAYCGFARDTGDHLKAALSADPEMPFGQTVKGYFLLLFAKRGLADKAAKTAETACELADKHGATRRERGHIEALSAWCRGDLVTTAATLEDLLIAHPRDLMALKITHYLHFYLGNGPAMRASIARVRHAWDETVADYGFVKGLEAFSLEESGDYGAAEVAGRRAIEINPSDIWACHAVAHVMEMQARHREGIDWITGLEAGFSDCNNFAYHVWWHRCLFMLELGDHDGVLAHYDEKVRSDQSEDMLDMSNGVSLLWRLGEEGVDVGSRWSELADKAEAYIDEHVLVFNDAHFMLALAATGRSGSQDRLLASLERFAAEAGTTEAGVAADSGLDLCRAIHAFGRGDFAGAVERLMPCRERLNGIGGSHAQRDVFQRLLLEAALRAERGPLAQALGSERTTLKPGSPWSWRQMARAYALIGDTAAAEAAQSRAAALRAGSRHAT